VLHDSLSFQQGILSEQACKEHVDEVLSKTYPSNFEQSSPVKPVLHVHFLVILSQDPCPEQFLGQVVFEQSSPSKPGEHLQSPVDWSHVPLVQQSGLHVTV
jgi:hypothetical protein